MADSKKITVKRMDAMKKIYNEPEEEKEIYKPVRNTSEESAAISEPYDVGQSDNKSGRGMGWYVVHTYSGYENKVMDNIKKAIENRHLENKILDVRVPLQDVTEVGAKGKRDVKKKILPGYVLIKMDADDNDAWYVVRNTRGVTGFVGPGSKPVPLEDEEILLLDQEKIAKANFEVGETVVIIAGPWKDTVGVVNRIDENKATATITVEMFGRETPVEIGFAEVQKLQ